MSLYLGTQKIPQTLVLPPREGLGPVLFAVDSSVVYRSTIGSSTATASITLPSAPKWYKCYVSGRQNFRTTTAPSASVFTRLYNADSLMDDMFEVTPTITNGGKTFSSALTITNTTTPLYKVGMRFMLMVYVL